MRGKHEIIVSNARLQYKFTVERNITILRGDSATGKTTLIEMIAAYGRTGEKSGVTIRADKPLHVLTAQSWQIILGEMHDSIVFIDEGAEFVRSKGFAEAAQNSDNYFVIATRASLFNLPYSTKEIYGVKNKSGNRYQGTKRLYAEFFPLYDSAKTLGTPDLAVTENSNAGYEFFEHYFKQFGIRCVSAQGKSKVFQTLSDEKYTTALVIVDGAAFGPELERLKLLGKARNVVLYMPESFEWLVLKADLLDDGEVRRILTEPQEYIESAEYFSWELFLRHS